MPIQSKRFFILLLLWALLLVGCQPGGSPAAQERSAEITAPTTAPSDELREPNTQVPVFTDTPIPTDMSIPSETPPPTQTPEPTSFEIYWTVQPFEASTGELAYRVDQPEVLELAKLHFWEIW